MGDFVGTKVRTWLSAVVLTFASKIFFIIEFEEIICHVAGRRVFCSTLRR